MSPRTHNRLALLPAVAACAVANWLYLWRYGPLWQSPQAVIFLYLLLVATGFYFLLLRLFSFTPLVAWLGTVVFIFSGSDLGLFWGPYRPPVPGIFIFLLASFSCTVLSGRRRCLWYGLAGGLCAMAIVWPRSGMGAVWLGLIRFFWNGVMGIISAYGAKALLAVSLEPPQERVYKRLVAFWSRLLIWLAAIILPCAYALLVFFIELRNLWPGLCANFLMIGILFLALTLFIAAKKDSEWLPVRACLLVFLTLTDVFSFWVVLPR